MQNKYEFTAFSTFKHGARYDRDYVCHKFADLSNHGWEYVDLLEDHNGSYYLFKRLKQAAQNPTEIDI